jgi:hypothetical protein
MDEKDKDEARLHLARAASQARNATKNTARAAKDIAVPLAEDAAEEIRDTGEKLEGTVEDAVQSARKLSPRALSHISGDVGWGFLALSVSLYAGALAYNKFSAAYAGRKTIIRPQYRRTYPVPPTPPTTPPRAA